MKTATRIKNLQWRGDAALYHLSEPHQGYEYVIVSAINGHVANPIFSMLEGTSYAHETYMFPATSDGDTVNMLEMEGSEKGTTDHAKVLRNAGYEISNEPTTQN